MRSITALEFLLAGTVKATTWASCRVSKAQARAARAASLAALAPVRAGQAPADLGGRGEGRLETDLAQPGEADELAVVPALQGPEAEAVLGGVVTRALDQRGGLLAAQGAGEVAHHLGVGAERGEGIEVVVAPGAQQQAWGLQFDGHCRFLPRVAVLEMDSRRVTLCDPADEKQLRIMPLPLVYHDDYSPPFPDGHRFPMEKFRLLRDHLVASGLTRDDQLRRPELCPPEVLALAHCPDYIARYQQGELSREDQRRLGLPWSEALARRTVRAVGGSCWPPSSPWSTASPATWPAAPTTPTTTSRRACIFNDLAVISRYLLAAGRIGRVLIFDCDVHQGDGTARILADTPDAITVSLHCEKNFPARKAESDWDIPADGHGRWGLPQGGGRRPELPAAALPARPRALRRRRRRAQDDALGYLQLTDAASPPATKP